MALCGAAFGSLAVVTSDGERSTGRATRGPVSLVEFFRNRLGVRPAAGSTMDQLRQGERYAQVLDITADARYQAGDPVRRALADLGGCCSMLSVPLHKDGALCGAMHILRPDFDFLKEELRRLPGAST